MRKTRINSMAIVSLITAVMCVLGPFTITFPISPVPFSLLSFMMYLSAYILGVKKGVISCILYICIGMTGMPVFSSFTGGIGKILGPTGGYIVGYIFMTMICGWIIEKWTHKYIMHIIGMILGTVVCYLIGTMWLSIQVEISIYAAIAVGVVPFIAGDVIKIVIASFIGPVLRKRLKKLELI